MTRRESDEYLPYIDGLRAIAVLSVLAFHLKASWLPGGFAGVDVFFVISGFVVSASVSSIREFKPASFPLLFYARRFLRIAPALVTCLYRSVKAFAPTIKNRPAAENAVMR
jgi:peptidoglycan/LPS O-acetylase OafA/YrhL